MNSEAGDGVRTHDPQLGKLDQRVNGRRRARTGSAAKSTASGIATFVPDSMRIVVSVRSVQSGVYLAFWFRQSRQRIDGPCLCAVPAGGELLAWLTEEARWFSVASCGCAFPSRSEASFFS